MTKPAPVPPKPRYVIHPGALWQVANGKHQGAVVEVDRATQSGVWFRYDAAATRTAGGNMKTPPGRHHFNRFMWDTMMRPWRERDERDALGIARPQPDEPTLVVPDAVREAAEAFAAKRDAGLTDMQPILAEGLPPSEKKCTACGGIYPISEFWIDRSNKRDGHFQHCKACGLMRRKDSSDRKQKEAEERMILVEEAAQELAEAFAEVAPVAEPEAPATVTCRICNQPKPLSEYGPSKNHASGRLPFCRPCGNVRSTEYRRKQYQRELEAEQAKQEPAPPVAPALEPAPATIDAEAPEWTVSLIQVVRHEFRLTVRGVDALSALAEASAQMPNAEVVGLNRVAVANG